MKKTLPGHFVIKLLENSDKDKFLKAVRKKNIYIYKNNNILIIALLLLGTAQKKTA